MVRDPVTGKMVSYAEMSILLQQRRKQRLLEEARQNNPQGVLVSARNTENTGAPARRGVNQTHWQRYEEGGDVSHPGKPMGTDTVPAWLTPGEFVVNAEAVRMYGPMIEQMNEHGRALQRAQGGTIPGYYNQGGPVFDSYFDRLLGHEGGYSDHAADRGGKTNYGITEAVFKRHYPKGNIKDLTKDQAKKIYYDEYYKGPGIDKLPESIREQVFDISVNAGPGRAIKFVQELGGVEQDGKIGPNTIKAAEAVTNDALADRRQRHYDAIVANDPSQEAFIKGWTNRANSFRTGSEATPQPKVGAEVIPPDQPVPEPVDLSPSAEAGDQAHVGQGISSLLSELGQPQAPIIHGASINYTGNPEYIPSITEQSNPRNRNQFYNQGGPVHMAEGGWLDFLWGSEEDKAKTAQALRRRPGIRTADPLAGQIIDTRGPEQPLAPSQFGTDKVPPNYVPPRDAPIPRFEQQAGVIQGQIAAADTPPVPGSDEALLQGSSQSVENREETELRGQYLGVETGQVQDPSEIENWSPDVPQVKAPPQVPGDTSAPTDSGWASLTQGEFLEEAQPRGPNEQLQNVPDPHELAAKEGERMENRVKHHVQTVAPKVEQVIAEQGEEVPAEIANMSTADATKAAQDLATKQPGIQNFAQNTLKQAFGDLFNPKELGRMAIMFLGAMATGASAGQALAFAGQQYISRVDAAAGKYERAVTSGKYTKESLKAYKESGDPIDLIPVDAPITELGQQKEFYSPEGKRIQARQVQIGDNKIWVDGNNKPVNLNVAHQDASRAVGTPEYRKRIQDESKQLGNTFDELQKRFGTFKTKDGSTGYSTDLTPSKVGLDSAKWAVKNDVPVEAMGTLLENAYAQARADSKDGKRAKSIEAYLNDQYIRSQVGDPTLFEGASAEKVNMITNMYASQLSSLPQFQGLSNTAISSIVMQKARPRWAALDADLKKSYNRRAGNGETGFMVWLREQL